MDHDSSVGRQRCFDGTQNNISVFQKYYIIGFKIIASTLCYIFNIKKKCEEKVKNYFVKRNPFIKLLSLTFVLNNVISCISF